MTSQILIGLALGFIIDLTIGWPKMLYRVIGHPVGWLASPVRWLERRLNQPKFSNKRRFINGACLSISAILIAILIWGTLGYAAERMPYPALWLALLFWPLIAARSMHDHVAAIEKPLSRGDLPAARYAVSMIVGRNPETLDQAGIARASLESLGENTSDGIIAPMFWGAIFGPAGIAGYKAINTLDSMIAHRNLRYEWFGKTAARIDDIANLIPARLTALLYILTRPTLALKNMWITWRDARAHRSPNAGWPETALAVGVGVRLSGPRIYGDHIANEPWLNPDAPDPNAQSIAIGLRLYRRLLTIVALVLLIAISVCV